MEFQLFNLFMVHFISVGEDFFDWKWIKTEYLSKALSFWMNYHLGKSIKRFRFNEKNNKFSKNQPKLFIFDIQTVWI